MRPVTLLQREKRETHPQCNCRPNTRPSLSRAHGTSCQPQRRRQKMAFTSTATVEMMAPDGSQQSATSNNGEDNATVNVRPSVAMKTTTKTAATPTTMDKSKETEKTTTVLEMWQMMVIMARDDCFYLPKSGDAKVINDSRGSNAVLAGSTPCMPADRWFRCLGSSHHHNFHRSLNLLYY